MGKRNTEEFLRFLNKQNTKIAEAAVEAKAAGDPIRLQREAKRRERLGTLRARPHSGSRPSQVKNIFGYIDPS